MHTVILAAVSWGIIYTGSLLNAGGWYSGAWDSTFYSDALRPHTIAFRVQVLDGETRLPLPGTEVRLEGSYYDRTSQPAQDRTERRSVITNRDGIAVFALTWRGPITGEIDTIEKFQTINVRVNGYRFEERALPTPRLVQYPREWVDLARKEQGAKVFVQKLAPGSKLYDKPFRSDPLFFEWVRDENYGLLLNSSDGFRVSSFRTNPLYGVEVGPYLVVPINFYLQRIFVEHHSEVDRHPREHRRTEIPKERWRGRQGDRHSKRHKGRRHGEQGRTEQADAKRNLEEQRRREEQARRTRQLEEEARKSPLGLAVTTLSKSARQSLGLYIGVEGAVITYVRPSSPAHQIGLHVGIVVTSIGHKYVGSAGDFRRLTQEKKKGDQFIIDFWRKNAKEKWERDSKLVFIRQ